MKNRKATVSILIMLSILLIAAPTQGRSTQFVLAGWDYQDEYGQGIEYFTIYQNATGIWYPEQTVYYYDSHAIDWNATVSIKLVCWTWLNGTLTDADDWIDGKNHLRHNVTVIDQEGITIFSQQNFTFDSAFPAINPPMWLYGYEVILNFIPDYGQIYTVIVTYESYWGGLP